jgi:5-methylcytosine-specific restriction endonuclease McrA
LAEGRPFSGGLRRTHAVQAILDAQNWRCALTGLPLTVETVHLDHIIPVSKGGTNAVGNLQWVHPTANYAKGNGTVAEFRAWLLAAADALRAKMQLEELL